VKGIVLAGDSGNRLHPLTHGIPTQLLPIYDVPMIYYPIELLVKSGIKDILIITSKEHEKMFEENLGDGSKWNTSFSYACQTSPDGIAQAINIAQSFIGKESVCLITGDTIIDGDGFENMLRKAVKAADKSANATVFVDHEYETDQYGRVLLDEKGAFRSIVGTSEDSRYYSITGIYVFPNSVLKHIGKVTLSERNKFEITSVSQFFHEEDKLQIQRIPNDSIWFDTNTPDNILKCSIYMQKKSKSKI